MITKSILIGGLLLLTAGYSQAQESVFSCDFETGIPDTFTTHDLDMNEPSRSMKKYGFQAGVAWVGYTENGKTDEANGVAYSGSWYLQTAKSDDWMITPAIKINDKRTILSWQAYALDAEHPDGYSVYISETGNTPDDFTENAIFSTTGENSSWTDHEIKLDSYAGKEIYIAFVNDSENCNILAIDNINVYTPAHSFTIENNTPIAIPRPGTTRVNGTISSSGFMPVEGYKLTLEYDGKSYIIDRSDITIESGETESFEFDVDITVEQENTTDYRLTASSLNDTDVVTIDGSITCFSPMPLLEETTGTWCGWCPGGQYQIELLKEKYPNEFIDIAVHIGNDKMAVEGYSEIISQKSGGVAPYCIFNRMNDLIGDPFDDAENLLLKAKEIGAIGKIECKAAISPDNKIDFTATAEFGTEINDDTYRLSAIIVEDKMTGYKQANYYSGGSIEMNGYEDLDDPIPAGEYTFSNVARAVYPSFDGDNEAFPEGTPRHTPIEIKRTYEIPDGIQNIKNVKIVAVITNSLTGEIVNAAQSELSGELSVENITTGNILISRNGSSICILSTDGMLKSVEIYNTAGQPVHISTPDSPSFTWDCGTNNLLIIKATNNSETKVEKTLP